VLLSRLKRELRITTLDLPQMDSSRLSAEETTAAVIAFWQANARV
jgi:hypothetical protein